MTETLIGVSVGLVIWDSLFLHIYLVLCFISMVLQKSVLGAVAIGTLEMAGLMMYVTMRLFRPAYDRFTGEGE